MDKNLAIHGGPKSVPEGTIRPWPPIDEIDRKMVLASLEGGAHAFGPNCGALQDEFAAWNGNKFALTTNSGTAALHMCVAACGCGVGDEVIVPAYSWSSSATCVLHHDCIPVFVDIDFATMNIDVDKIEAAISEKTKAILVVHLHGLAVDMPRVLAIARKHNLKVIEDCCQAHGAEWAGRRVGTWGDCAAFSFNQNKVLCSGEGGMFVTDDEALWQAAKQVWSFGETRTPSESRDYHAYALGWMYRNNDLTAAFGRAQLSKIDQYLAANRRNAEVLSSELTCAPYLILPTAPPQASPNWYNYTIRFDMEALGRPRHPGALRDRLLEALQAEGAQAAVWQQFILPAMTVFQAKNGYGHGHPWSSPHARPVSYALDQYPVAQRHCETHIGFTTPLRAPNDTSAARQVAAAIKKVMARVDDFATVA